MPEGDVESLVRNLAWLYPNVRCRCDHEYLSAGRLYGVSMGKSWQRVTTHPLCPHHGDKAQAYFRKHRCWPGPDGIS
jgi:hypothetical protein